MFLIALILVPFICLLIFGIILAVWFSKEEPNIFVLDEKQKIEHDKNREGIPQRLITFRELNAQAHELKKASENV